MSIIKIEKKLEEKLKSMFESEKFQAKMTEFKEVENDDAYKFKVVVTTEWVDRDGEVIKADWIEFKNYMKNPVVLVDHSYKIESIVWKTLKIYQEGTKTIAEWVFAKDVEKADLIRTLYSQGFIKTVSIGFIAKKRDDKDRSTITKSEMLEFSFVAVPANPEALSLDGKIYQKCLDQGIIKEVKEDEEKEEKKEFTTETVKAEDLKAWDVVTYRNIEKWTTEDGREVENIYPSQKELPRMWKIIQKLDDGEEMLTWWNEMIIASKENPLLLIQNHISSEDWPKTRTNNVFMKQFDDLLIERIVSADDIEKGFKEFDNSTEVDLKDVLDSIQELKWDVSSMKTQLKTFADDKAEEKNLSKVRELGKELQKSLSALNKEAKAQN